MKLKLESSSSWVAVLALACGCIARPQAVRPDQMSAAEHRQAAAREQVAARDYERKVERPDPLPDPLTWQQPFEAPTGYQAPFTPITPEIRGMVQQDDWNERQANRLREEARQHKRAAATLETFEATACGGHPEAVRAACPLLGPLAQLEDVPGGVRVTFSDPARADAAVAHMRCHFAYEQTRGFAGTDACPLFMRGLDIRRAPDDPMAIDLTSPDPEVAADIRELSRRQAVFAGGAGANPQ